MTSTRQQLLCGSYQLSIVNIYRNKEGEYFSRWTSKDAVVLKAISLVISEYNLSDGKIKAYHLKGTGGLKGGIRAIRDKVGDYKYAMETDVADFYGSMDHEILFDECKEIIKDKRILRIIRQYMNRLEICDGNYQLITRGICRGCPLSPIMRGIILKSLDKRVNERYGYVRYMDDWVILTKTRGQLREVVKLVHELMARLKFKLAIAKTYIGKISKGFDFLGYRFDSRGIIGLARKTVRNFINKTAKLYEQGATLERIGCYINQWYTWCRSGISA